MKNCLKKYLAPIFLPVALFAAVRALLQAYKTGRGNLMSRGVVEIEETKKGTAHYYY